MLHEFVVSKPAFCGFDVPRRVPQFNDSIFFQTESAEEAKYKKVERLWEGLWTGLMDKERTVQTASVESSKDGNLLRKLLRLRLRLKHRTLEDVESSSDDLEDFLMPAYPPNYRDPVAIY